MVLTPPTGNTCTRPDARDPYKTPAEIAVGLSLAGCFQSAREQAEAAAVDDDALCQKNGGPPGSNGYAACMKDRDVQRSSSQARIDRAIATSPRAC